MSAISPFRSHLLQQWARQAHGRAPAAVAPWLKSSNNMGAHQGATEDPAVSLHSEEVSSRGYSHIAPSISTLDSDSYSTTLGPRRASPEQVHARTFVTGTTPDARADSKVKGEEKAMSPSRDHHGALLAADKKVEQSDNYQRIYHDEDDASSMALKFQSILMDRRTSTNLTDSNSSQNELCQALDRAVACAQMAPNHKRTEPTSFLRFVAGSEAAKKLARIAYEVSLREKGSVPNAESKQRKWLRIPGFLVALVHENQGDAKIKDASADQDEYDLLPYLAPETERQLEDYAAACAAVQNVLLSLHSEDIGSKWATGPVIRTRAFRQLVNAQSNDRVVGLIMVGGSTNFESDQQEQFTAARRHRRRSIRGDLLRDLT